MGLGNPGLKYRQTRHNIGFKVIDSWSRDLGARLTTRRFRGANVRTRFKDHEIILLRPLTFMNQSGKSVKACLNSYGLKVGSLLVVHDDLDLPVGRIKVVINSGAGGHKGVESIIQYLGSTAFPRVKIGIGRPRHDETPEEYVLSPFYSDEKNIIEKVIHTGIRACELFVSDGIESTMNYINCQKIAYEEVRN